MIPSTPAAIAGYNSGQYRQGRNCPNHRKSAEIFDSSLNSIPCMAERDMIGALVLSLGGDGRRSTDDDGDVYFCSNANALLDCFLRCTGDLEHFLFCTWLASHVVRTRFDLPSSDDSSLINLSVLDILSDRLPQPP